MITIILSTVIWILIAKLIWFISDTHIMHNEWPNSEMKSTAQLVAALWPIYTAIAFALVVIIGLTASRILIPVGREIDTLFGLPIFY